MNHPDWRRPVRSLHEAPDLYVLTVTGGGSLAIGELLAVPGASQTLLSAGVPYAQEALQDFLCDWSGPIRCTEQTARRMAVASFDVAHNLVAPGEVVHGVACTASLASDREKRGPHRVHVAAQSAGRTARYSLELLKGTRTRRDEELLAAALVLDAALEAAGLPAGLAGPMLATGEAIERVERLAPPEWPRLGTDVAWRPGVGGAAPPGLVLPGAFNPLHEGHLRMAAVAERLTGKRLSFELSMENVDKPPLDFIEVGERVAQFVDRPVLVTLAPTFVEKASLMPGCTFVVGIDTLIRIADEEYYDQSEHARDEAIAGIADTGCRFLVFGRAFDDEFITLDSLGLPAALAAICDGVSEQDFRLDISSTELRGSSDA